MDYKKLADMLFPNVEHDADYYLDKYKKRNLSTGQVVSRYAPSPTGYMHLGNFFQMFIAYNLTRVTDGVLFLRVEDTDFKREKDDAMRVIYEILEKFNIKFDEYQSLDGVDHGEYGPYVQSKRVDIYQAFAKKLVSEGKAFPCFCKKTEGKDDVLKLREHKWDNVDDKEYDPCRDMTLDEVKQHLDNKEKFAIRLKTRHNGTERIVFNDLLKGDIEAKANAKDFVILKNDGVPPYAFAHAIDDTLMGTTIVVRGEEYISSTPMHIELFEALEFPLIQYCHNPLICKIDDNGNRRKISKRQDPEADMRYYFVEGYPTVAVLEYLLNLINSGFEDWRRENPNADWKDFTFGVHDITTVSPIFDLVKLKDISKNVFARMNADEVYNGLLNYTKEYDADFYNYLISNKEYVIKTLDIDRGGDKPRKDIYNYSMIKSYYEYMFSDAQQISVPSELNVDNATLCNILHDYSQIFANDVTKEEWFDAVKVLAEKYNYATNNKEYKQNPDKYAGNLGQFCGIIRKCITGKDNTPDLYSICMVLGKKLNNRVQYLCENLNA